MRVLIVDDQALIRSLLTTLLSCDAHLHLVGDSRDGLEALQVAADQRPDVVLMDLDMPRMDGVTATTKLRRLLPDTHVIIFTDVASTPTKAAARQAGACQVLTKTARAVQILSAVRTCGAGDHPAGGGTLPT